MYFIHHIQRPHTGQYRVVYIYICTYCIYTHIYIYIYYIYTSIQNLYIKVCIPKLLGCSIQLLPSDPPSGFPRSQAPRGAPPGPDTSGSRDCFGRSWKRQFPATGGNGPIIVGNFSPKLATGWGPSLICEGASCCFGSWWERWTGGSELWNTWAVKKRHWLFGF